MVIQNKQEIIAALGEKINSFINYIAGLNKEEFESTPNGKWSAGQNLEHLIRAIQPLQQAYGLPKFVLHILFGKTNRPSRSYGEIVAKYKSKLTAGLIKKYEHQKKKLIAKIEKQTEENLDKYILPHPLLGKVTLREMLFFTIHHNEHHLESLKNRV